MPARILLALDTPDVETARAHSRSAGDAIDGIKLGLEFFVANGPGGIAAVRLDGPPGGRPLFLDLKLHDIPNTVAGAARAAASLGVSILNVHAQGGAAMMRAALDAVKSVSPSTKLIAVTMLTSLSDEDLPTVGLTPPVADQVLRLASLTQQAGLDGVVCSPHEITRLRAELGPDFLLVVPGIRPAGAAVGDQRRVMGPAEARDAGADILVIGRPITAAQDPGQAAQEIAQSLGISDS